MVDGEVTTVQTTQNYATSIYGDSSYAVGDNVTTNSSGYITNLSGLNVSETDGYQTYMGTKRVSNETVGLGNGWYTYSDDVVVARYDGSDLTISTISSIRDDANDMVVAVFDSGSVVAMLIMEDAVSESIVDDGDIDLNDAVKVDDQEALDAALENIGENDIILLSGGTYELSATVSGDLTIVGTGNVVIEAVDATSVSGIYMNSGNLTVSGVDFVAGSTEGYARGIHTAGGYNGTITVVDCTFDGLTTGIFLNGCNNITVESCTFTDCTAGIGVDSLTGTLQITDCTFSGNGEDIGIGAGVSAGDKVIGDIEGLNINDGRPKHEEPVEEPEV